MLLNVRSETHLPISTCTPPDPYFTTNSSSTSTNSPSTSTTSPSTSTTLTARPTHLRPHLILNPTQRHCFDCFLLLEDYRARLPHWAARFTGYRGPDEKAPYDPLPFPPFTWLVHISLETEVWIFAWVGAFGGILLVEAIMSANTVFRNIYHSPSIITSFGASAVLLFGIVESPLAQPRNFLGGHFIAALFGTAITRLFALDPNYEGNLDNTGFHANTFLNGGISMATVLLAMLMLGCLHPPAGSTALNTAVQSAVVTLSWRYIPVVLASALIMQGWALVVNNLGRRRYPLYWWSPERVFVRSTAGDSEK